MMNIDLAYFVDTSIVWVFLSLTLHKGLSIYDQTGANAQKEMAWEVSGCLSATVRNFSETRADVKNTFRKP